MFITMLISVAVLASIIIMISVFISVADTFDALTSTRVYRPALADEIARAELVRVAGTQLDPEAVSAFFAYKGWEAVPVEHSAELSPVAAPA